MKIIPLFLGIFLFIILLSCHSNKIEGNWKINRIIYNTADTTYTSYEQSLRFYNIMYMTIYHGDIVVFNHRKDSIYSFIYMSSRIDEKFLTLYDPEKNERTCTFEFDGDKMFLHFLNYSYELERLDSLQTN